MVRVRIADRQNVLRAPRPLLVRVARVAAPERWRRGDLSLVLVDAAEMAVLNRRFTGRNGQTDVLAFPLEDDIAPEKTVGEVVVNATLARDEARARRVDPLHELLLYVVHGIAHLDGFDDHSRCDRKAMYAREEEVFRRVGVPYPRHAVKRKPTARRGGRR